MTGCSFVLVDVFTQRPFSGNSLAVFPDGCGLTGSQMLAITQELRHFESVFLAPTADPHVVEARVFDLIRELDFAGHPIMGAAAVLHRLAAAAGNIETWSFRLPAKTVPVSTARTATGFQVELDQGRPEFGAELPEERVAEFAGALNLSATDLTAGLRPAVVSTGLRYLVVPVESGLEHARITCTDFEEMLASVGAEFAYVVDVVRMEGRHWNNDGLLEDVATGSGAGTVAAYLTRHRRVPTNQPFQLRQGRFVGRPSEITLTSLGSAGNIRSVRVGGPVAAVGHGHLDAVPIEAV